MTTTPEPDEPDLQIQSPRDSAFASPGWVSSTCSVRSDELGYWELHGRFPLPIDEVAEENHDLRHKIFDMVLKKNFCAPVNLSGANVLKLYARTGILAIDIADEEQPCQVIAVDESEMKPEWTPPNVTFEICDLENGDDWTWRRKFQLIIIRQYGGLVKDLPTLVRRCYE